MQVPIFRQFVTGQQDAFCDVLETSGTLIGVIELVGKSLNSMATLTHSDLIDYCNALGYRTALLVANSVSFNCACYRDLRWLVAYRGHNFNIVPPKQQNYALCIYDVFKAANLLQDINTYPELPENHYHVIQRLPSGWTYKNLKEYGKKYIVPEIDTNYKRICWYTDMMLYDDEVPVHPSAHRPLTHDEWIAVMRDNSDEWINQLVMLFLADHWKQQDFESTWHSIRRMWLGENTPDKLNKLFDLHWFGNREHFPHIRTLPHYKFEMDTNLQVITPPNLIEEAFNTTYVEERGSNWK